eukprot:TRINITY_DN2837_c0_g1_i2.p1 TRINITY_DN2837_c0_g1~~TRINITY_DN2837_c0_g1_i2.p1  ORF type:complete len:238 (+),score=45.53 TRINITY_DN2837_c0_g1_i2:247-960(+)
MWIFSWQKKNSYFHGILNPAFQKQDEEEEEEESGDTIREFHISRDGHIFKYILEYITYGDLFSSLPRSDMIKLALDADFYSLPDLKALIEKKLESNTKNEKSTSRIQDSSGVAKWHSTIGASNGGYWNWNITKIAPDAEFYTCAGNMITVKKKGLYLICIRVTGTNSSTAYASLYVNGSERARAFQCENTNYIITYQINETFAFNTADRLQVYQCTNGNPANTAICNTFSIVALSTE